MKCFSPYVKKFSGYDYPFYLPCGSCPACRYNSASDWSLRISLEAAEYNFDEIYFVTLTYSNEYCPSDYSLIQTEISDFMKRFRKHLLYKIRFFGCGEYGDVGQRPHYHLILFGIKDKNDLMRIGIDKMSWIKGVRPTLSGAGYVEAWHKGFVEVEAPRSIDSVAGYIAQYVTKKLRVKEYTNRIPPYHRQSLGIGKDFLKKLPFYTPIITYNGYTRSLGKYLRNKLAEMFGIADIIKQRGKDYLNTLTETILSVCDTKTYDASLAKAVSYHFEKFAYLQYYSGELDLQTSKLRNLSQRMNL